MRSVRIDALCDSALREVSVINHQISNAEKINTAKTELLGQLGELRERSNRLNAFEHRMNMIYKGTLAKVGEHRTKCIETLESCIEGILAVALPDENFKAKLTFKTYRNNYVSNLYLGKVQADGKIKWQKPKSQNGDFVKQLTSFSVLCALNMMLGSRYLLNDEPFSSSDSENVAKLAPIFQLMQNDGLQIIIIEHKEPLYKSMEHHEINLKKTRVAVEDEFAGFVHIAGMQRVERTFEDD